MFLTALQLTSHHSNTPQRTNTAASAHPLTHLKTGARGHPHVNSWTYGCNTSLRVNAQLKAPIATASGTEFDLVRFTASIGVHQSVSNGCSCEPPDSSLACVCMRWGCGDLKVSACAPAEMFPSPGPRQVYWRSKSLHRLKGLKAENLHEAELRHSFSGIA